jgi:hypothetical protein
VPEALRALTPGLFDLATALIFLVTWIRPTLLGRNMVKSLMLTMIVEFLAVHSFAFLVLSSADSGGPSVANVVGFGAVYLFAAGVCSLAFRDFWPLLLFAWLIGSKLWSTLVGEVPAPEQALYLVTVWVISTGAYLLLIVLTVVLPLPRLGIAGAGTDYGLPAGASGAWVEQPHRVIAFGFLYFLVVAVARAMFAPGGLGYTLDTFSR